MSGLRNKTHLVSVIILVLPLLLLILSLFIGSYSISPKNLFKTLIGGVIPSIKKGIPTAYVDIVFRIRLPRLLLALAVGASLSVSGASLQAFFKNPLVNEYILGISSGAAFGAALSLILLGKGFPVQVVAFLFSLIAVLAVLLIAGSSDAPIVSLLLTGVIVSAFFSALLALVEYFANPYALQTMFFWLLGSISLATWRELSISLPLMEVGLFVLILLRWRMNVFSMSSDEAKALGVDVRREKMLVIIAAGLATASATAIAGIISWVGLIVPHLVRMLVGVDNRKVIPLSAAFGASFLILADDIIRGLSSFEIPIGIFTSIIGIPLFIFLLKKSEKVWL